MLRIIFVISAGFVSGIAAGPFLEMPVVLAALLPLGLLSKRLRLYAIFLIGLAGGLFHYQDYLQDGRRAAAPLLSSYGDKVSAIGVVEAEPEPGASSQRLSMRVLSWNGKKLAGDPGFIAVLPRYPEYRYGDILSLYGRFDIPENYGSFRYDRYLERYGDYGLMYRPKAAFLGSSAPYYQRLLAFKKHAYSIMSKALPEPAAGLAQALVLGYKKTLFEPEQQSFSNAGLSHLVAISGSHLTLLAALATSLLLASGWSRSSAFYPVVSFIWGYTVLTGCQPSAVRAAIMNSLFLYGEREGKAWSGGFLLILAAAIMLLANPLLLRDDLGFQLSFAAMAALFWLYPPLEAISKRIRGKFWKLALETVALTVASQLATWPITAVNFGKFSLVAPLANAAVAWAFTWLLPGIMASTAISAFIPAWSWLIFWPWRLLLDYVIWISSWMASWPGASIDWAPGKPFILIYYLILAILALKVNKRRGKEVRY